MQRTRGKENIRELKERLRKEKKNIKTE